MKIKKKALVGMILIIAMMMNFCIPAFATDVSITQEIAVFDDEGQPKRIVIEETPTSKITTLYNQDGQVELRFVFDKKTNILRNPENGTEMQLSAVDTTILEPCAVFASGDKDYEYEFCKKGQTKKETEERMTIGHIGQMVGILADTVAILTFLYALPTITALSIITDNIKSNLKELAVKIADCLLGGVLNKTVYIDVILKCEEMYENDPFYPTGGFWFLGYYPSHVEWAIR